jgi:hypothetical protein
MAGAGPARRGAGSFAERLADGSPATYVIAFHQSCRHLEGLLP